MDEVSTKPSTTLDPEVCADLKQQLELNLKKITRRYVSFVNCVRQTILRKGISAGDLSAYLLALPAFKSDKSKLEFFIMSEVKVELEQATTVNNIFNILNTKYATFMNYDIFQDMVDDYDLDEGQEKLKYPEHLDAYIKMHKLSEFEKINSVLKKFDCGSKKVVLKFDIEMTCNLAKLQDLTKAVANILGLRKSALRLLSIEEGCVIVTLLIPAPVADFIFRSDKIFSAEMIEEFQAQSLLWLVCNGSKYEFNKLKDNPQLTSYSTWSRDEAGRTPLHTATQNGELEVVKHLLFLDEVPIFTLNLEPGCKLSDALKLISQRKLSERHRDFSGNTPLHTACIYGQLNVVKLLTREVGCDPNNTNSEGLSCLQLAAQHGHLPLVRYLVEGVRSNMTHEDEHGRSSTYLAAGGGHLDILKYLIEERRADPHFKTTKRWKTSLFNIAPSRSLLHTASSWGHYNVVRYLVEQCFLDPSCEDDAGAIPLHLAGHYDVIEYLIEECHCDPLHRDSNGVTPLHDAAANGRIDIVQHFTVTHHCDPQVKTAKRYTPLMYAAMNGNLDVVKFLIEDMKCDPNVTDMTGEIPLHDATRKDHFDVAEYFLNVCHSDPLHQDSEGVTPLHVAAACGRMNFVRYFTLTHHCSPQVKTAKSYTPLMYAAMNGHLDIVKFLIEEMKCDPNVMDMAGEIPLHDATRKDHFDVAEYFLNVCHTDPLHRDIDGVTPLHVAAACGRMNFVRYFTLTHHCSPQVKTAKSYTPLMYAAMNGHLDVVKFLIEEMNCDPNVPDMTGEIPLHDATRKGHFNVVEYLVEVCHCDPLHRDSDSVTPLHIAAANALRIEIIRYYISTHHCDPRVKTKKSLTPLDYAAQYGHEATVKCLLDSYQCDVRLKITDILRAKLLAGKHHQHRVVSYLQSVTNQSESSPSIQHAFNLTIVPWNTIGGRAAGR